MVTFGKARHEYRFGEYYFVIVEEKRRCNVFVQLPEGDKWIGSYDTFVKALDCAEEYSILH